MSGAAGGGRPCLARSARRSAAAPHERVSLIHVGVGAILPVFCPTDLNRAARTRITLQTNPPGTLLIRANAAQANPAGRTRTSRTRLKTARSAVRSRPCPPHQARLGHAWSQHSPMRWPQIPALSPTTAATGGRLSPLGHSPVAGATPTPLRAATARLTARSCAAGPRASQSRSGRRLHGARGRRGFLPRTMAPP